MIKKFNLLYTVFFSVLLLFIFSSCSNLFTSPTENSSQEETKTVYRISGNVESYGAMPEEIAAALNSTVSDSRSAISIFPDTFMYIVTLSKDGTQVDETEASESKSFTFEISETGTYTFEASIYNASSASECTNSTKLFYGSTDFDVTEDNSNLQIETSAYTGTDTSGSISLDFAIDNTSSTSNTAVTQYSYTLTGPGTSTSVITVDKTTIVNDVFAIIHTNLLAGVYTFNLVLYNENDTEILKYTDKINVFNNLTTNRWVESSTSPYINESGTFTIPSTAVAIYNQTEFYVDPDADESGTYASMFDPVKTIDEAYEIITGYQLSEATILIKSASTSEVSTTISTTDILDKLCVKTYANSDDTNLENNAVLSRASDSDIDKIFSLYSGSEDVTEKELSIYNLSIESDETYSAIYSSNTDSSSNYYIVNCQITSTAASTTDSISPLMLCSGDTYIENCEISGSNYEKGLLYIKQTDEEVVVIIENSKISGNSSQNSSAVYIDNAYSSSSEMFGVNLTVTSSTISDSYYGLYVSTQDTTSGTGTITIQDSTFKDLSSNSIYSDYNIDFLETNYFTNTDSTNSLSNSAIFLNWKENVSPVLNINSSTAFNGEDIYLTLSNSYYQEGNQLLSGNNIADVYSSINMVRTAWSLDENGCLTVSNDIYVSADGDDSSGEGTEDSPYHSINTALRRCVDSLVDWNIILLSDYDYSEEGNAYGTYDSDKDLTDDNGYYYVKIDNNILAKSITIKSGDTSVKRTLNFAGLDSYPGYLFYIYDEDNNKVINFENIQIKGFSNTSGYLIYAKSDYYSDTDYTGLNITSCILGDDEESQATSSSYANTAASMIYASGVNLSLYDTYIQHNYGNGLYITSESVYSEISLSSSQISYNTLSSAQSWAGFYTSAQTYINAGTIISNNKATDSSGNLYNSNLYLDDQVLYVSAGLSDSKIYLSHSSAPAAEGDANCTITSGYSTYNSGTSPSSYFKSDLTNNGIDWDSDTSPSEAVLKYQEATQGGISYTQDDLTFTISSNRAYTGVCRTFSFTASISEDDTETDITSTTEASNWTLKAYYQGEDVTDSSYFSITNTDGDSAVRSIKVEPGLETDSELQLYVALSYNDKTYGGSFDIPVVDVSQAINETVASGVTSTEVAEFVSELFADQDEGVTLDIACSSDIAAENLRTYFNAAISENSSITYNLDLSQCSGYAIADSAFSSCTALNSVILPEGATSIGESAFSSCSNLTSVTGLETYTSIGASAFTGTSSLSQPIVLVNVTSIGNSAFKNSGITGIDMSAALNLTDLSSTYVFSNCESLSSIQLPESLTSIGDYCFQYCSSLTSIEIPENISSLGSNIFAYSGLTWASIACEDISTSLFLGCTSLESVEITDNVTTIGNYVFKGCTSLESVELPANLTTIGAYAFYGCSKLSSIIIPDSVSSIGVQAFYQCQSITSVTLPSSLTSIASKVFYQCTGLTSVSMSDNVTSIGTYAFYGCTGLTDVTLSENITTIGNYAFNNCNVLESITIPDGVTSIGDNAFYKCSAIASLSIPESVISVGEYAFGYCTGLTNVPNDLTSIGSYAFCHCTGLTTVTLNSESLTALSGHTFDGCTGLTSVTLPDTITEIGVYDFQSCTSLSTITLPSSLTTIKYGAFSGCTSLTEIELPEGLTTIVGKAFYGCTGLTSINIPSSVTTIYEAIFYGCTNLTSLTFTDADNNEFVYSQDSSTSFDVSTDDGIAAFLTALKEAENNNTYYYSRSSN